MEDLKQISACTLFNGMSETSVAELLSKINYTFKTYAKGDYLIKKNSYLKSLFILVEGEVYGEVTDENGKVFHLTEQKAPIALASALVFGKDLEYPLNILAKTNLKILQIEKTEVMNLMQTNQLFFQNYMEKVAERTHFLHNKISCFSLRTLKEKLFVYLLRLSKDQNSDTLTIKKSQSELAHHFGVNRPSLTREIRNLHNNGFIQAEGKEIKLLKKQDMQRMIACNSSSCINSLRD